MSKKRSLECLCLDCKVNTRKINEFYMIQHELWYKAVPDEDSTMTKYLCIECLERRLGQKLRASDFMAHVPINWPEIRNMSARLLSRIKSTT